MKLVKILRKQMSFISFDYEVFLNCLTEIKKRVIIKVNFRKGE